MIDCDACEKRHRDKEGVIKCRLRLARKQEKAAAKAADQEKRQNYAALHPLRDYLQEQRTLGRQWVNINADVKRLYPTPLAWAHECAQSPCPVETCAGDAWSVVVILGLDSERFHWPMTPARVGRYAREVEGYVNTPWVETVPWKKAPIARGDGAPLAPLGALTEWYLELTEEVEDAEVD